MNYQYENLDPERFQHVCQALLVKEFPRVQCFPVGQRDGGRDAISFVRSMRSDEFNVYQVKFVRDAATHRDARQWLLDIIKEEAPKVKALIPKGAKEYYLLTNVPGTAYPDSGSIDSANRVLSATLGIPSQCWWRDDLNRRMDNAWDLKWQYLELATGADVLRFVVEQGLTEDKERRTAAIRAFLRDQFERDKEVRFKQVELQNNLLDLFIDVPLAIGPRRIVDPHEYHVLHAIMQDLRQALGADGSKEDEGVGAASFLLHPLTQQQISRVVLEGAPGQGKSTITQYVCQIHRRRLLNKPIDIPLIPEEHRRCSVRIPFKIDLRDLSAWLSKTNPFDAEAPETVPSDWHKSLESFMTAQVRHYAGGAQFTVSDLHAVAKVSSLLLVFDGLDEVADIPKRREVVEEVTKGVQRLTELSLSLQAIVTSRPAAFANSPGLSDEFFVYLVLGSITKPLIEDYTRKWLSARRLEGRDASEVWRILREKLDLPHLRELARNPMQLAILLSLIHTRGASLPDKRTALYDSYVELFFSREAEKSQVVRNHRDLLIDIHRYVAWVLHSEAETGRHRGAITVEELKRLVSDYLAREQHDTSLANLLFTGMVERVVALVSRVEGTYEFEVQPLREYFAARFLYDTAPYSPAGAEKRGTLPDRFDATARNFYWLNVTRFYAGCFSKGELPSLVERLEELARSDGYRHTSYPQVLAGTLLSDWVFSQSPKAMRRVVSLILDGLGLRHILSNWENRRQPEIPLILPRQCGNEELVDRCFTILRSEPPFDFAVKVVELLRENGAREEIFKTWLRETLATRGIARTRWMGYGLHLGALSLVSSPQISDLLSDSPTQISRLSLLLRSGQRDFLMQSEAQFTACLNGILVRSLKVNLGTRYSSLIELTAQALDAEIYSACFTFRQPIPLKQVWEQWIHTDLRTGQSAETHVPQYELAQKCAQLVTFAAEQSERTAAEWASSLAPWDALVEKARNLFGDCWALYHLANIAAGVRSKEDKHGECDDPLDNRKSLCGRARYARLRAGNATWWANELRRAMANTDDGAFVALVFLAWSGPKVMCASVSMIDALLRDMPSAQWHKLSSSLQVATENRGDRDSVRLDVAALPANLCPRTVAAISMRLDSDCAREIYVRYLRDYRGDDPVILQTCQGAALELIGRYPETWERELATVEKTYSKGTPVTRHQFYPAIRRLKDLGFPLEAAKVIAEHADRYPSDLVSLADARCRQELTDIIRPVATIADEEGWFLD